MGVPLEAEFISKSSQAYLHELVVVQLIRDTLPSASIYGSFTDVSLEKKITIIYILIQSGHCHSSLSLSTNQISVYVHIHLWSQPALGSSPSRGWAIYKKQGKKKGTKIMRCSSSSTPP